MSRTIDLMGQRFGRLTVTARATNTSEGRARWSCLCDCGHEKTVPSKLLLDKKTTSCGCFRRQRQSKVRKQELLGRRFGLLVVESCIGLTSHGNYSWLCRCDCGTKKAVSSAGLLSKARPTRSCGCLIGKSATKRTLKDIVGQRYGRLTCLSQVPSTSKGVARWRFKCDCGGFTEANGTAVRYGAIQSCGCLRVETSRKRAKQIAIKHLKADGFEAYAADPEYAQRPCFVYLVELEGGFHKFGIAFNVKYRGRGEYLKTVYERQMPRASCWTVEQIMLQRTQAFCVSELPRGYKCHGYSEFRQNLPLAEALQEMASFCDLVEAKGWTKVAAEALAI